MFSAMPIFANDIVIISVKTGILFFIVFFFFFLQTFILLLQKKEQEMDRTSDEKNKRLFISSYFCLLIKDHDFSPGRTEQNVNKRELRPTAVKHQILSCLVCIGSPGPGCSLRTLMPVTVPLQPAILETFVNGKLPKCLVIDKKQKI